MGRQDKTAARDSCFAFFFFFPPSAGTHFWKQISRFLSVHFFFLLRKHERAGSNLCLRVATNLIAVFFFVFGFRFSRVLSFTLLPLHSRVSDQSFSVLFSSLLSELALVSWECDSPAKRQCREMHTVGAKVYFVCQRHLDLHFVCYRRQTKRTMTSGGLSMPPCQHRNHLLTLVDDETTTTKKKMCVVLSSNAQVSLFSSFPCGTGILEGSFHRASSYTWDVSCENMRSVVRLCLTSRVGLTCTVDGTQLLGQTFRKRRSFCWGTKDKKKKRLKKQTHKKKGDITCPSLPTFLCVQTTCTFLSFTVESLCVLLKTVKGGWTFKKIINAAETVAPAQLHVASKRLVWAWRVVLRCTCLFYWHLQELEVFNCAHNFLLPLCCAMT